MLSTIATTLPPGDWANISVGVAAVLGLIYVVRSIKQMQKDILYFIGNHMTKVVEGLALVSDNLSRLNERVDRLHDDNVETARVLMDTSAKDHQALKEFEARVKERHLMLAEKLGPRTKVAKALMEAILEEPVRKEEVKHA